MKKKIYLLLASVLTFSFLLASCSDDDTSNGGSSDGDKKEEAVTDTADYTVIFWGMAGSNDESASYDLANLAYNYQQGAIGKNVQIAGLMKTSLSKAQEGIDKSYDKTMYFDSKTIGSEAIKESDLKTGSEKNDCKGLYKMAFDNMGGKEYGDTLYPLNNVDSLAGFIKKTAEKFPARHYVLMLFGHGNGFSPILDTPTASTKGCVSDDFRKGELSADDVVSAVSKSGVKMQTLFTQCCLMGTLENIAAYSQVFDYGVLSAELTGGFYFPEYLVNLSKAGDDETKMQQQSRALIDYYVQAMEVIQPSFYTSHGFYDLRKTSTLLAAVKEAANWYKTNYAVASYRDAIEHSLASTIVAINLEGVSETRTDSLRQVRQEIQNMINGQIYFSDEKELVDFCVSTFKQLLEVADNPYSFSFADMMRNTIAADLPQEKTSELKAIYEKYMSALKDMAYIRTTQKPSGAVSDYEYIYASPTVNVFSMNPDYFIPLPTSTTRIIELVQQLYLAMKTGDEASANEAGHLLLEGTPYANLSDLATVKHNYTSSVFDKQVGWSGFLELLELSPSLAYCPDRWQANQSMK